MKDSRGFRSRFYATKESSKGPFLQNDSCFLNHSPTSFPPSQKNIFQLPTLTWFTTAVMKAFIMEGSSRFFFCKKTEGIFWVFSILAIPPGQIQQTSAVLLHPFGARSRLKRLGMTSGGSSEPCAFFFLWWKFFFDSTFIALRKAPFFGVLGAKHRGWWLENSEEMWFARGALIAILDHLWYNIILYN